ncbi:hypothetical protein GALMADRAFT_271252 [Galerina marginata CBS 339.88]|uniref:F-box domain-containing protein n=1 Tax=Galerina marginata (strain CBS 339.88) TaxID=685588 RepID=A0A067SWD5_GALM3|nr:hypothetical protein GALMADRAFT_271252 [Galerina marginata CBS 339.88]
MESPDSKPSYLNIEELAQALFLVLGSGSHDTVGRPSPARTDELRDLERHLLLALSQTRTVDNASSQVNRLPPEVLAHIFSFLQHRPEKPPYPTPQSYNSWLRATHVCRYWRIVAFAFPRLWNYIHIRGPLDGAAVASIMRSGKVPLKVYYDYTPMSSRRFVQANYDPSKKNDPLAMVADHADRLQELHLTSDSESIWNVFRSPMANLEVLSIIGRWPPHIPNRALPCLFANDTPNLRKLVLARISSWPLNDFHNLTHLSLYNQYERGGHRSSTLSLNEFLDILRACPDLEELVLVRAGPNAGRSTVPPEAILMPVSLPSLRDLEIGDWVSPDDVAFFLSHLTFPKKTTLCIWGDSLDDLSTLLNININNEAGAEDPYSHITRIVIVGDDTTRRQMLGLKQTTLYIHGDTSFSQFQSLFQVSPTILPNVLELVLSPTPLHPLFSSQLRQILSGLSSLVTLTLSGAFYSRTHRLSSALGVFEVEDPDNANVTTPLLHTVNIVRYAQTDDDSDRSGNSDMDVDILPLALLVQTRAERGHPIPKFEIEGCRLDQLDEFEGHFGQTRVYPLDAPFGKRMVGRMLDEMWRCVRDATPGLSGT